MKLKKIMTVTTAIMASLVLLVGCGGGGAKTTSADGAKGTKELKLAHNLNEQHTVHIAIQEFANLVNEKSNGSVKISIFPNGLLGSEGEVLEQLQAGAVAMTKVAANSLATYEDGYNAFTLPFVFDSQEHYYKSMDSTAVQTLYEATKDKGFVGITFYTSGARSIYTKNTPINTLADLKGLKIRVQDSPSQVDMIKAMGGTPVTMPYGDVYTALQSGVIDGAESNETALTNGKHGEVCKYFSYDEHTRIPDILVISSKVWDTLTPEEQIIIKEAAKESTEHHKELWDTAITESVKEAEDTMQVKFNTVDQVPFQEATKGVRDDYAGKYPMVKTLLDAFDEVK